MTDKPTDAEIVQAMAVAISGAPFPSKASLRKAQAALAAQRAMGLVLVPVEPTEAMVNQGGSAFDHPSLYMGGPSHTGRYKAKAVYSAMIAAAQEKKID